MPNAIPADVMMTVFIAAKKSVSAVDASTGQVFWTTEIPGSRWASAGLVTLTVDPTGVYASRQGNVSCLDPLTGHVLWSIKPPNGGNSLPIVATMMSGGDGGQAAMVSAAMAQQAAAAASTG